MGKELFSIVVRLSDGVTINGKTEFEISIGSSQPYDVRDKISLRLLVLCISWLMH